MSRPRLLSTDVLKGRSIVTPVTTAAARFYIYPLLRDHRRQFTHNLGRGSVVAFNTTSCVRYITATSDPTDRLLSSSVIYIALRDFFCKLFFCLRVHRYHSYNKGLFNKYQIGRYGAFPRCLNFPSLTRSIRRFNTIIGVYI